MPNNLTDKVAIVTGGSSGFGLGIVEKFLVEGAKVLIMDLSAPPESVVSKYTSSSLDYMKANVTVEADWEKALAKAIEKYGHLDIVVNNAGVTYRNQPTEDVVEQDFDKVFNVNVKSFFFSTKVIVPYFIKKNEKEKAALSSPDEVTCGGTFIQISSTAALRPRPRLTWYNATKGAVSIASKSMAVEYGPHNIRFNCICPVAGDTPLLSWFMGEDTPEKRKQFIATVPLQRFSKPSDIANATAFLASDDAKFITGVDMEVDGGRCV